MRFCLAVALALVSCATTTSAESVNRHLLDESWWLSRARDQIGGIEGPEDRAAIASLISATESAVGQSQKQSKPPEGKPPNIAAGAHQSLGDIANVHLRAGRPVEALQVIERFESDYGGGYAVEAARQLAELDDWARVSRAVDTIRNDYARGQCLAEIAVIAVRKKRLDLVTPLLQGARQRLEDIADLEIRSQAAQSLARAYVAGGDSKSGWDIVNRHGADFDRAMVLIDIAQRQLDSKDSKGFAATMARLNAILTTDRLHVSRNPELPDSPQWRRPRQFFFTLLAARLQLRAGDRPRAAEVIRTGLARAENPRGIDWRADIYFENPFVPKPSPEAIAEIADLMELMPTPIDRALLAVLGSSLAAQLKAMP